MKVDLEGNDLTGTIPSRLGNLMSLEWIKMGNNRLTGTLPAGVFGPALRTFNIEINSISGTIPEGLFDRSVGLEQLNLGKNNLNGTLSGRFGELGGLELLLVYLNRLTGTVPSSLGELEGLVALDVGYNGLGGFMPPEICSLRTMGRLLHLAADCDSPPPSDDADDEKSTAPPLFRCDCCTHCYPGYDEPSS